MTGFVYFLRCGDFVKVGFSKQPKRRLCSLRTASPYDVELLAALPGSMAQESAVHRCLQHLRVRNEWFRFSPEITVFISQGLPITDDRAMGSHPVERIVDTIGVTALSRHLGHRNPSTVSSWKQRKSIPVSYWPKVVEAAANAGETSITFETLAIACNTPVQSSASEAA